MKKKKKTLKHLRHVALSVRNGRGSHCGDFLLASVLSAILRFSSSLFQQLRHVVGAIGLGYSQFACFKPKKKKNKKKT